MPSIASKKPSRKGVGTHQLEQKGEKIRLELFEGFRSHTWNFNDILGLLAAMRENKRKFFDRFGRLKALIKAHLKNLT